VRKIDAALDLSWLRGELASHYSSMNRPPIDPERRGICLCDPLERLICLEVQVNLVQAESNSGQAAPERTSRKPDQVIASYAYARPRGYVGSQ
jgi:hypothetical protein